MDDQKYKSGIYLASDYLEWYFSDDTDKENEENLKAARNAFRILRNASEDYIEVCEAVDKTYSEIFRKEENT